MPGAEKAWSVPIFVRVLGVGSPFGDDRVGWAVIAALRASGSLARFPVGAVETECCDRPGSRLVQALSGIEHAIVIDAMRSGAAPGTIVRLTASDLDTATPLVSAHGFGVAEALALARVLGALPPRLVVFGVELGRVDAGDRLSAPVEAAVMETVRRIVDELGTDHVLCRPGQGQ